MGIIKENLNGKKENLNPLKLQKEELLKDFLVVQKKLEVK